MTTYNLLSVGGNYSLAQSISQKLHKSLWRMKTKVFADQEVEFVDVEQDLLRKDSKLYLKPCVILFGIDRNQINTNVLELLTVMNHLRQHQIIILALACFYLPYCRQNYQLTEDHQPSILRYLLHQITQYAPLNFIFLDVHTENVRQYLSGNIHFLPMHELWYRYILKHYDINDKFLIIAPDAGAKNRAIQLSNLLNADFICMRKIRKRKEINFLHANCLRNVKECHIIIVDDIIDKGETLMAMIDFLRDKDALNSFLVFVTHGLLSSDVSNLNSLMQRKKLILSNSLDPIGSDFLDVTDLFVEAIKGL